MKNLIKRSFLLLFLSVFSLEAIPQALVFDPGNFSQSISSFLDNMQELTSGTSKLASQAQKAAKLAKIAKQTKEAIEVVSGYVAQAQEIMDIVQMGQTAINLFAQTKNVLINDKYLNPSTKVAYLERCMDYMFVISRKTAQVVDKYRAGSKSSGNMTDYQRIKLLMQDKEEVKVNLDNLRGVLDEARAESLSIESEQNLNRWAIAGLTL